MVEVLKHPLLETCGLQVCGCGWCCVTLRPLLHTSPQRATAGCDWVSWWFRGCKLCKKRSFLCAYERHDLCIQTGMPANAPRQDSGAMYLGTSIYGEVPCVPSHALGGSCAPCGPCMHLQGCFLPRLQLGRLRQRPGGLDRAALKQVR